MIEQQRSIGRRGDPEREATACLEKIADVDRKRSAYQDQQAEGLITIDELRSKLVSLEETRKTVQRELEGLRDHQEHMAGLEADRDPLLESYAEIAPDALDSLRPEQRQRLYALLRIEIPLAPDGSFEVRGVAFAGGLRSVCETDTPRPSRAGPSWSAGRRVTPTSPGTAATPWLAFRASLSPSGVVRALEVVAERRYEGDERWRFRAATGARRPGVEVVGA